METRALIFDIKRDCSEDGPGIRTTVFFKGCPLSCHWCQNPEGRRKRPELSFRPEACAPAVCGFACISECEVGCLFFQNTLQVDFDHCMRCGRCIEACPAGALEPVGDYITLDELLYRISVDAPFHRATGGGVTLSGGEATAQMAFAHVLLKALKKKGVHTALETCGFFHYRHFKRMMLPYLDLIYFDLKLIDEAESLRYTGRSNRLILENFKRLTGESKTEVIPRIPLIPGVTDSEENLSGIAAFLKSLGVPGATLLPYNPLWRDKLARLNFHSEYDRTSFMSKEETQTCIDRFAAWGSAGISGVVRRAVC